MRSPTAKASPTGELSKSVAWTWVSCGAGAGRPAMKFRLQMRVGMIVESPGRYKVKLGAMGKMGGLPVPSRSLALERWASLLWRRTRRSRYVGYKSRRFLFGCLSACCRLAAVIDIVYFSILYRPAHFQGNLCVNRAGNRTPSKRAFAAASIGIAPIATLPARWNWWTGRNSRCLRCNSATMRSSARETWALHSAGSRCGSDGCRCAKNRKSICTFGGRVALVNIWAR
jgi:hypothetical protein